jgi:hypothetical protein
METTQATFVNKAPYHLDGQQYAIVFHPLVVMLGYDECR